MTDYTLTSDMYDDLQGVERVLDNALGALEVLAETLEKPDERSPEGLMCWFICDGLKDQHKRLEGITEGIMAIRRGERLKIVDNGGAT